MEPLYVGVGVSSGRWGKVMSRGETLGVLRITLARNGAG